jgi:nucleoside-diphosphate-sugar epimerase
MSVLIIGDGLLGSEIIKQTGWDYISRKKDRIDFTDISTYKEKLSNYDTILNCVGFTKTYSDDNETVRKINYEGVISLSDYCEKENKKLIHISTDYVYTNSKNNSTENDLPLISPNWYTYYKLLSDEYIVSKNNNFLVCRCSFKPNPFPYENAWVDHIGNFDYVDVISTLLIQLINTKGLFNVGTEIKSIYDLAIKTNSKVTKSFKPEMVPSNVSMDITKLTKFLNEN